MSWRYRQPLCFFWTIPGTVLVGPSLQHLSFPEVIGAFYATSVLILALGASGWVKRAMQAVPMPIVMGMVAGVFLRFGLDLVRALHSDLAIAAPMVVAFFALSALPALGRRMPPLIGALLVGALVVAVLGRIDTSALGSFQIVRPVVQAPAWSLAAMIELVVPLAITVLVVQNGQGFAVLQAAGHHPPINAVDRDVRHRLDVQRHGRRRQLLPNRADQRPDHLLRRARTPLHRGDRSPASWRSRSA